MIEVGIFIYANGGYKQIELFQDETISLTSTIQDINDIGKVFTDFSQSFTIPASKHNNAIFKHWYENSIINGFDSRNKVNAYIELDTIPFRFGKIQLEKAQYKKGVIDNYQITFLGSLVSLKDTFAGKQLKDIDFSSMDFTYNPTVVINRVSGSPTADVKFPLITSNNVWQYGGGGSSVSNWDISNSASPIYTTDLFPAMRVSRMFEIIGTTLGITFDGEFLENARFTNLFLWLKNTDVFIPKYKVTQLDFQTNTSTTGTQGIFDVFRNRLNYTKPTSPAYLSKSNITITFSIPSVGQDAVEFTFYVYRNGIEFSKQTYLTQITPMYLELPLGESGQYTFHISAKAPVTFTSVYYFETKSGSTIISDVTATQSTSQTTQSILDIGSYMPEMSLEDFFTGILKMFNLTCYSLKDSIYQIEQLEDWYDSGEIKDLSKYIISDNIEISKTKPYNRIKFNYKASNSFMNKKYLGVANHEYGDLNYELNNDGSDYSIQLPFENLLFQKFSGTQLQVGFCLDIALSNFVPNPVILYDYGTIVNANYKISDGTTVTSATAYNVFGQDTSISSINYSINFGSEQSSFTNNVELNSLYANYYSDYVNNIFDIKSRIVKVDSILPSGVISKLKLNDRVIIRGKRYVVNSLDIELTSGITKIELLNDFRTI
jgi:hypothetical protein